MENASLIKRIQSTFASDYSKISKLRERWAIARVMPLNLGTQLVG